MKGVWILVIIAYGAISHIDFDSLEKCMKAKKVITDVDSYCVEQ